MGMATHTGLRRRHPSVGYQLNGLFKANRDGSFGTQRKRVQVLRKLYADLREDGYLLKCIGNLKLKHIERSVTSWKVAGLTTGEMKTRLSFVRWLCFKIGKPDMVSDWNIDLGLERRANSGEDKAWRAEGSAELLADVHGRSPRLALQMKLMEQFGLRFREAATLQPHGNDLGAELAVVNGTKGGRKRRVAIFSTSQRRVLDEARAFAGKGASMIPLGMTFEAWRRQADGIAAAVGLSKDTRTNYHALRHRWAQNRYKGLTGFLAPCRMTASERAAATPEMVQRDREARQVVALELGHGRTEVCRHYLGSPLR